MNGFRPTHPVHEPGSLASRLAKVEERENDYLKTVQPLIGEFLDVAYRLASQHRSLHRCDMFLRPSLFEYGGGDEDDASAGDQFHEYYRFTDRLLREEAALRAEYMENPNSEEVLRRLNEFERDMRESIEVYAGDIQEILAEETRQEQIRSGRFVPFHL